jgi:dihydroorotate dehydrogenase
MRADGIIAGDCTWCVPPRARTARTPMVPRPSRLYPLLRPLLFALDPESAHDIAFGSLDVAARCGVARLALPPVPDDPVHVMGITFPNRVGLAAGLDKNAEHVDGLAAFGFGHIECGTVTPRPQPGNPKPRLFRLVEAQALINRMGFNNGGLDAFLANVARARFRGVLGLNIGKNFDTPNPRAVHDYLACLRGCYPRASYVAVNVSSPNTKGLRDLQHEEALAALAARLKREQRSLADAHGRYVPIALKIAPDLDAAAIEGIARILVKQKVDGVIATNTTIGREGVESHPRAGEAGGLSGRPLREKSTRVIRTLARALDGALPIIGVGGILSGADAREKIDAGASLVQLYTGLVYRGPELVAECVRATMAPSRSAATTTR